MLSEVDPDSLVKLYGLREQVKLNLHGTVIPCRDTFGRAPQDALDTALGLCCLFGLGPPVMFLIEQGVSFV